MGMAYAAQNDPLRAEAAFAKALQVEPGSASASYELGRLHAKMGRQELAKMEWEQTLKIDPGHVAARERLAALDKSP